MEKPDRAGGVFHTAEGRRSDDEVAHLMTRIRSLVAEQRRLDASAELDRHEANAREIDRLQDRLVIAVKRELSSEELLMSAPAPSTSLPRRAAGGRRG